MLSTIRVKVLFRIFTSNKSRANAGAVALAVDTPLSTTSSDTQTN